MNVNLCRKCPEFVVFPRTAFPTSGDKYGVHCYKNVYHYSSNQEHQDMLIATFIYDYSKGESWIQFKKGIESNLEVRKQFQPPDNCNFLLEHTLA